MTPKEKAEQLVLKYLRNNGETEWFHKVLAKNCAIIAVDEVLILITAIDGTEHWQKYYEEVKQEIEKL